MPHPLMREPAAPDESETVQADLFPDNSEYDWQDGEPDTSLAYYDSDEQPDRTRRCWLAMGPPSIQSLSPKSSNS